MNKYFVILFISLLSASKCEAQYAAAAGQPGSTAIFQDSSIFYQWANFVEVKRGFMNIADTILGKASYGNELSAIGKADNNVVSLGDGGSAILSFENPIKNGSGWDFAVFENSFDGSFLELAFVEVSSDGSNFFRFPAHSLSQNNIQIGTFGNINPEKINNLAGKYKVGYGTPFDLEELKNIQGLDINNILKIKIIDVVGSIDSNFASFDTANNIINDPWPSSFSSSGFDLDAIGVIHSVLSAKDIANKNQQIKVYPNPASTSINIHLIDFEDLILKIEIFNTLGQKIQTINANSNSIEINLEELPSGLYVLKANTKKDYIIVKQIIKK
ncbi:MAG: hypothetical protein AUJ98_03185 [Bacteroidetes bacterium CG2_30_33_31]|nr:MAG: hypothetical protein AUJ98_03185 [Bacteroidetes bacterium CG2_30_33_31]